MIIYVIKAKVIKKIFFIFIAGIIIAAIAIIGASGMQSSGVFKSSGRDLPIYYVDSQDKKAAITFDCAWGAGDIPDILATLKNEEVKASFFLVGQWAEKFPDTVKMIADEGHDIASHGYSHLRMGALDREKIKSEIALCGQKLSEISGSKVDLFRPPYGDYSNNVVSAARELGYFTIQWNVDSIDTKVKTLEGLLCKYLKKQI